MEYLEVDKTERQLFGRKEIYTDTETITSGNVVDVLTKALKVHVQNQNEIEYLYDYYRGKTPILEKTKEIRQEINNKINVNRANEAVNFFLGYGFGEPIQYIRRSTDESLTDDINAFNEYMFLANKDGCDKRLAEWMFVGGYGNRMILPGDEEEPFRIFTLDPRYSFVVKHSGPGEPVVMGVKFIEKDIGIPLYSVYTKDWYYEIEGTVITKSEPHFYGDVPIFEYAANKPRLGVFEIVLPLLDAINALESNRMDDVVQYVNSFLALLGGSISDETYKQMQEYKIVSLPDGVDAKYLSTALQQADTQVMADNLYQAVLTVVGMPNRNGGSSTSDTGSAVIMRDGWEAAEARMKIVEQEFKESEKRFIKTALRFVRELVGTSLKVKDIDIKFTRRNYEGLLVKSQVLTTMLACEKIHPRLAFVCCGMFPDPESAYLESKAYWEEQERKLAAQQAKGGADGAGSQMSQV